MKKYTFKIYVELNIPNEMNKFEWKPLVTKIIIAVVSAVATWLGITI